MAEPSIETDPFREQSGQASDADGGHDVTAEVGAFAEDVGPRMSAEMEECVSGQVSSMQGVPSSSSASGGMRQTTSRPLLLPTPGGESRTMGFRDIRSKFAQQASERGQVPLPSGMDIAGKGRIHSEDHRPRQNPSAKDAMKIAGSMNMSASMSASASMGAPSASAKRPSLVNSLHEMVFGKESTASDTVSGATPLLGRSLGKEDETGMELSCTAPTLASSSRAVPGNFEKQVEVVTAAKEWGEGATDSSDSDDWHNNRRHPGGGRGAPPADSSSDDDVPAALREKKPAKAAEPEMGELEVKQLDKEWGAGVESSDDESESDDEPPRRRYQRKAKDSSSDDDVPAALREKKPAPAAEKDPFAETASGKEMRKAVGFGQDEMSDGDDDAVGGLRSTSGKKKGSVCGTGIDRDNLRVPICAPSKAASFFFFASLYVMDHSLRFACLVVHSHSLSKTKLSFYAELFLLVMGAALSSYITFHDLDVIRALQNGRSVLEKLMVALFAFLILGCLQVIQIKRAWERRMFSKEALQDIYDHKKKFNDAKNMPHFDGSERIMPVALITGVPYLMVNHLWSSLCDTDQKLNKAFPMVIFFSTLVTSIVVSTAVADLDFEVSHHVWKRYHLKVRTANRTCKAFFPVLHRTFRFVEVCWRGAVLASMVLIPKFIFKQYYGPSDLIYWDLTIVWAPVALDYLVIVLLLRKNAPSKDQLIVHMVAGISMLTSDLAHFVDRHAFTAPARTFSKWLSIVRFAEWVVCCFAVYFLSGDCQGAERVWDFWPLLIAGLVYYPLRFFFPICRLSHDLHTAAELTPAQKGKRRIEILLSTDDNGQVLDLNARSKDALGLTPLMRAASKGHTMCVELLLSKGASVDVQTVRKETALHFAAATCDLATCKVLIRYGADVKAEDNKGQTPMIKAQNFMASKRTCGRKWDFCDEQELQELLTGGAEADESGVDPRQKTKQVAAVTASNNELRNLFPEIQDDTKSASPLFLHSVSALVISRAFGGLARRIVFRREDERQSGSISLSSMVRIKEIGKGGFGKVIEVEVPSSAGRSILSKQSGTRYALKLQLKQHAGQAHSEVLALQRAAHPFIVHLESAFSLEKYFALLLELCPTDLNRILCERQDENGQHLGLTPFNAARYMGQILLALSFLHQTLKTVFRDMKPENVLISLKDEAKLTDFGLAKVVTSAQRMTMCGTAGFWPPEITATGAAAELQRIAMRRRVTSASSLSSEAHEAVAEISTDHFDKEAKRRPFKFDTYSYGVTLQLCLLGEDAGRRRDIPKKGPMMLPLHVTEQENEELLGNLRDSGRVSPEAFDLLVEHLLCYDVEKRSCLTDPVIQNHEFFLHALECANLEKFLLKKDASPLRRLADRLTGKKRDSPGASTLTVQSPAGTPTSSALKLSPRSSRPSASQGS